MNEQFIDRVINVLVEMRLEEGIKSGGEATPRDLKRERVAARRARGKKPPLSTPQLKASKIARGDIPAPPSKVSKNLDKLMFGTAKKGS